MTTEATGVRVVDQARRDLDALPLPACGERVGVRGTRIRCARSAPHPISLIVAASGPLPAGGARAPRAPAPCTGKPDESASAAYFRLTRVTRIFQKRVLTKIARPGRAEHGLRPFYCPPAGAAAPASQTQPLGAGSSRRVS